MSKSQWKSLRLSTWQKLCLQGEVQCVCWSIPPSASNYFSLQKSLEAAVATWTLLKMLPTWSGVCLILRKKMREKGEEGKELRKCLFLVFGLFLAQKTRKAIKVNGSPCWAWTGCLYCFLFSAWCYSITLWVPHIRNSKIHYPGLNLLFYD